MILVDTHEPDDIYQLLAQSLEVQRMGLWTDYVWANVEGRWIGAERKQWGEVVGRLDEVEEQLSRELRQAEELLLIIEGVIEPTPTGVHIYTRVGGGKFGFRKQRQYGSPKKPQPYTYSMIMSWLWRLEKEGVQIWMTPNYTATAMALVSFYKQGLKKEHTTLKRYIRKLTRPPKQDPHVTSLMGIQGAPLGEVRAKALVKRFRTFHNVMVADPLELMMVEGMGATIVARLFHAIGRKV